MAALARGQQVASSDSGSQNNAKLARKCNMKQGEYYLG